MRKLLLLRACNIAFSLLTVIFIATTVSCMSSSSYHEYVFKALYHLALAFISLKIAEQCYLAIGRIEQDIEDWETYYTYGGC